MARIESATGRYGGRPASERHAERRTRFREAGLDLFGAGPGFRASRLVDVCKRAGLSTRQFYEEYDTPEDLLADLHLYVNDLVQQSVVEAIERSQGLPPLTRVDQLFHAYIGAVTADPRHTRITFVEIIGVSERLDQQRLERRAKWIDLLVGLYEEAAARGEIGRRDFRLAAAAVVGSINGLMHDWTIGWVDAGIEQVTDELILMATSELRAQLAENPARLARATSNEHLSSD